MEIGKALVIFSGGQDSTTCLGWARNNYLEVEAITFTYGQKHKREVEIAREICEELDVPHIVVDTGEFNKITVSGLIGDKGEVDNLHSYNEELPSSFVPNRNGLFMLIAHNYAMKIGATAIIMGVCETDYSGYPDCRRQFIHHMAHSLFLGTGKEIPFITPLMDLDKAETFELADREGVLDLVLNKTLTCYNGVENVNEWGKGCGECPSCKLRKGGYYAYKQTKLQ